MHPSIKFPEACLLWGNVIVSEVDAGSLAAYFSLICPGQMLAAQLTAFAAGTDVTAELVNLKGHVQTGQKVSLKNDFDSFNLRRTRAHIF